jgi:hypothetical protein
MRCAASAAGLCVALRCAALRCIAQYRSSLLATRPIRGMPPSSGPYAAGPRQLHGRSASRADSVLQPCSYDDHDRADATRRRQSGSGRREGRSHSSSRALVEEVEVEVRQATSVDSIRFDSIRCVSAPTYTGTGIGRVEGLQRLQRLTCARPIDDDIACRTTTRHKKITW